ncbi:MAG TPA: CPBP family intramembrane glutamic endopeptidase [Pyrinomonadaceae bacterium]|nr:CPBP family intramembrane glutamic endopeptidase [Pyrinomonadaceae bacterium]
MKFKTRLFVILWIAGMAGVLSFLLVDLSAFLASLPVTAGTSLPFPPLVLKLLSIIQTTILLSIAVLVGVVLAHRVGLSSPAAEAAAGRRNLVAAFKPQIVPGLVGGLAGGIAIPLTWLLWRPFLPPTFVTRAEQLNRSLPFPTRLLYGGLTEELLLRWGVMTLLVWLAWRLLQKGRGKPRTIWFVCAIIISSVIFGLGHLPVVTALAVNFTVAIVGYIVFANSLFGLIAGYLYWKRGLEAAVIAHMSAHVVIITAIYLGT